MRRILAAFIVAVFAGLFIGGCVEDGPAVGSDVRIVVVNVGKADSVLVQLRDKNYLIDTGTEDSVPALFAALGICGVEHIDGLFLTHMHSDHVGGLQGVLSGYSVGTMYRADIAYESDKNLSETQELAAQYSVDYIPLWSGDSVEVADGISFEVLAPLSVSGNDNDNSLVLRLSADGKTYMFTGDMQMDEELTLLGSDYDLAADFLKVGNHGNPDSTSNSFANAVRPQLAVISTDTEEDSDSANIRVYNALTYADVYCTEDYEYGVSVTVSEAGEFVVSDLSPGAGYLDVSVEPDFDSGVVYVTNNSGTADLSGCIVYEDSKDRYVVFPPGTTLKRGQSITVGGRDSGADICSDKKNFLKDDSTVCLYDKYGNVCGQKG